VRKQFEDFAVARAEQVLDEGTQMTAQKFRGILANNRSLINACIDDLAENDSLAEERLDELVSAMEAELKADLQGQADQILNAANLANQRLEGLSKGEGLNPEQKLERQFVMILHRMQRERDNPSLQGSKILLE
jgi:hypothetical protein